MARLQVLNERLRETLWVAPVVGLLLAMALTVLTIQLDDSFEVGGSAIIGFGGEADSARSILSTIAASMLSFLALVFTLTVIALQLASGFSPRLLRSFLVARSSKVALSLFVATFTYATLILREVSPDNVPDLSVTVATVLAIVSVIIFVYYVSSIAQSLRVANIIEQAGATTRGEIDRIAGDGEPAGSEEDERRRGWSEIEGRQPDVVLVWPDGPGVVTAVDLDRMRRLAEREDVILELRLQPGDFLPAGAPAIAVYGKAELDDTAACDVIATASERTIHQDAAFGLRQLVDIAARGLSPGVNDPTTAVQALDQIHDILLRLGSLRLYPGVLRGDDDALRVLVPVHSWADYVHLGVDEIRLYSEGSLQVCRRLSVMLGDLRDRLPASRAEPVEKQIELLEESIAKCFENAADREWALLRLSAAGGSEGGS